MVEHKFVIVELVNGFLRWLLGLVGVKVAPGAYVLPTHLVMAFIITIFLIVFFKLTVKNLSIFPSKMQNVLELIYRFFQGMVDEIIGHDGRKFIPVLGTLGLFIAVSNFVGLIPELSSPTANVNTTVGCAVFIICYYHVQGIRKHGLIGYLKASFVGPVWWLAPIFIPIEVMTHFLARPLSLSMRLFGNIFGEDMVIIIIASLVPVVAPLPVMGLAVFTSLLQAFIFVMLSTIYLAGAVSHEH